MANEYKIYTRPSASDAWTLADTVSVDELEAALSQLPDGLEVYYAITTVTASGIESTNLKETSAQVDADGFVRYPPNALTYAYARTVAGGKIEIDVTYNAYKQVGVAAAVQIAQIVAGQIDWNNPVATVSVGRGLTHRTARPDMVFSDGEIIRLAARAITGQTPPGTGPIKILPLAVAKSIGPTAVEYLEVSQI